MCSDREMRQEIEQMIVKDGYCIASSHLGYSLVKNRIELEQAMNYLSAKAEAISIRKNCLLRNFREIKQEEIQQELF